MSLFNKSKQQIIDQLKSHYGDDFKSPLARDLAVNVSTVRRIFNQKEEIPLVYERAIQSILCQSNTD